MTTGFRRMDPPVALVALAAFGTILTSAFFSGAAAHAQFGSAEAAAKYRATGQAVKAQADGTIIAEAEEFAVAASPAVKSGGWKARGWGENYYVASFANAFLSRQAFLGAPEQADGAAATIDVQVPKAGRYLALVRYEAAYRFETQFTLKIEQAGQVKLNRLYGACKNVKIWAFKGEGRGTLTPEAAWSWGAGENVVWEGHDAYVDLAPGVARLTLIANKQTEPAAKRNVDLVMLTADEAQVKERLVKENYLPLDGMLTQEGDVFIKLHNQGGGKVTLTLPPCTEHSPYWVHIRQWKAKTMTAEPGKSNAEGWVEVGSLLDTLNDGQWTLTAASDKSPLRYAVEVGAADAAGKITTIGRFESARTQLQLGYHGDLRYRRSIRTTDQVLYDLVDYLKKQPVRGKLPQRTLIYAYTFERRPDDPKYNAAVDEFLGLFNLATTDVARPGTAAQPRGYVDVRGSGDLEKTCAEFRKQGVADKIAVVSFGDEIGLAAPPANDHEGFRRFLQSEGIKPSDVDPAAGSDWAKVTYQPSADKAKQPRPFYFAKRYQHHVGIQGQKKLTDVLRKHLPQAGIGANYSPHHGYHYLGEVHQWITLFRRGGMTMPWSEDYIWQVPVGSHQVNSIGLDMFRAAIKGQPSAKIMYYVMPHSPGNTPAAWRRQFYGDLAHGMQIVDLFEFRPVQAAYTENYCSDPANFAEVRKSLHELGQFEDIVQDGRVQPGVAAMWLSETADIWDDNSHPFAAAKRSLYIAIRHQQLPLDFVVEEDALAGDLKNYRTLYVCDRHVSRAASRKIADWVAAGGKLIATAGAGMFDEFHAPNDVFQKLLGVTQKELHMPAAANVVFEKQDLPFSEPLDTVTYATNKEIYKIPVIAARARFTASEATAGLAQFADGTPAATHLRVGKGHVVYLGFLPGLSYFKPAIPRRPVDRGAVTDSMAHLIPTEFHAGAAALLGWATREVDVPVRCSNHLVESTVLRSKTAAAIPLVNWSHTPVKALQVTVKGAFPSRQIALASGNPVQIRRDGETLVLMLDLDVADTVILR